MGKLDGVAQRHPMLGTGLLDKDSTEKEKKTDLLRSFNSLENDKN